MPKFLKLQRVALQPEAFVALEYEAAAYVSWVYSPTLPGTTWRSDPLPTDALVLLLASRGWHQTDIGDELDEARKFTGP